MTARAAVVDTHALLWAATGQTRRLGRRALRWMERVEAGLASLYVPTTVLVEVGEAVWRGKVLLDGGFDAWVDAMLSTGRYFAADLTVAIVRRAQTLHSIPERGDRLIAATAAELDLPLITRDPSIAQAAKVAVVW